MHKRSSNRLTSMLSIIKMQMVVGLLCIYSTGFGFKPSVLRAVVVYGKSSRGADYVVEEYAWEATAYYRNRELLKMEKTKLTTTIRYNQLYRGDRSEDKQIYYFNYYNTLNKFLLFHKKTVQEDKDDKLGHDDDDFLALFMQADFESNVDCFSYLTKDYLGISFSTSHAAGDHFEIELPYEDIEENIIKR